jgi:hypothetical protein
MLFEYGNRLNEGGYYNKEHKINQPHEMQKLVLA